LSYEISDIVEPILLPLRPLLDITFDSRQQIPACARGMNEGRCGPRAQLQASLEHLAEAERSWDKFVADTGMKIKSYPTEVQVVTYMSAMSRRRGSANMPVWRSARQKRRKGREAPAEERGGDGQQPVVWHR